MSGDPIKPLPPDVQALLDEERAAAPAPAAVRDRVRGRIYASLGIGAAGAVAAKVANATPALGNTALPAAAGKALLTKIIIGSVAVAGLGTAAFFGTRALRPGPSLTAPANRGGATPSMAAGTAPSESALPAAADPPAVAPPVGPSAAGAPSVALPSAGPSAAGAPAAPPTAGPSAAGAPAAPPTAGPSAAGAPAVALPTAAGAPAVALPSGASAAGAPVARPTAGPSAGTLSAGTRSAAGAPVARPTAGPSAAAGASAAGAPAAASRTVGGSAPSAAPDTSASVPAPAAKAPSRGTHAPATRRRTVESAGDEELAAERRLLEDARRALASSPSDALRAIDAHGRSHPRGQLIEEREALRIRALAAAHRTDEAQRRGLEFRKRFPTSLFLPAVEHTLQSLR
jgi:hypothetical protein